MSSEEQELLARIGQLAGQINRHRNQQVGSHATSRHHSQSRHNTHRHSTAPYRGRGHRYGRGSAVHHHRTLQLNNSASSSGANASKASSDSENPSWVSKTDRHRQLINANVFERESRNRAKAIEDTRKARLQDKRYQEKTRLRDFLRSQPSAPAASANPATATGRNEITIDGIRFCVMDGGKKLARINGEIVYSISWSDACRLKTSDAANSGSTTPKSAVVAGVKFHRTKTGNLVVNRIVKEHRRSGVVKKIDEPCKIFSTTGSCPKGPSCRYIHDPDKVALCKDFLRDGTCVRGDSCDLSHDLTPERVPNCLHYAKGQCTKQGCPYTHSQAAPSAPVCQAFGFRGYCPKGADCSDRHVFECPNFSNTGKCNIKGCKLLHRERASVLRNQAILDERMEDVSSDEDPPDSDDVDSDEIAEFIEADSDISDDEDRKEFLPL